MGEKKEEQQKKQFIFARSSLKHWKDTDARGALIKEK